MSQSGGAAAVTSASGSGRGTGVNYPICGKFENFMSNRCAMDVDVLSEENEYMS